LALLSFVVVLGPQAREVAGEITRLLLLEEQALDVRGLVLQPRRREVDDREVGVGHLGRDRVRRVSHQEPDRNDQIELLLGERREVGDVVTLLL